MTTATLTREVAMTDTAAVPRDFRAYLKRSWPLGYDYEAEALQESHLSRLYRSLHATRHDGGTPPLLESFVRDLDAGLTAERQKRGIVVRAVDWHTVNGIIEDVRAARGMARAVEVLEIIQIPPRAGRPSLEDWCHEQPCDQRTAYRLADSAILAVWVRVVRWARVQR